jgi:hypothetical protein
LTVVKPYLVDPNTVYEPLSTQPGNLFKTGRSIPNPVASNLATEPTSTPAPRRRGRPPRRVLTPPLAPRRRGRPLGRGGMRAGIPRQYPNNPQETFELDTVVAQITLAAFFQDDNEEDYKESRQKETLGLIQKGVFAKVNIKNIPHDIRIFNDR